MDKNKKNTLNKPKFYGKDDPKNPKNINADKLLEEVIKKRDEEIANKKIIINISTKKH